MQEGNRDHANEISQSGKAMVADMKAAGTPADLLKSALHAYHALACRVNAEFSQVADDPFATQLLRHRARRVR